VTHIGSTAHVLVGGNAQLHAASDLSVVSTNTVTSQTVADGSTGSSSGTAAGASFAMTILGGDTETDIAGSAGLQGSTVTLKAVSDRTVDTQAKSTLGGATDGGGGANTTQSQQALADNHAKTSDGNLGLAAAIAISTVSGDSVLNVSTSGALTATGAVTGLANAALSGPASGISAQADGTATGSGATGIAAAVAINTAGIRSRALLSGATTFSGSGISFEADLATTRFGAKATSGAGASNVGTTTAEALLTSTANVTLVGATLLTLKSQSTTHDGADASAQVDGQGNATGVGASVAINVADDTARALLDTNARLTGVNAGVVVNAVSNNTVSTTTKGGSSGGNAITPVAAITVATHDTFADVKTQAAALAVKSLTLTADHTGVATTAAEGAAKGSNLSLGLAFSFASVVDTTRALVDP
jgi:hypothetical protein